MTTASGTLLVQSRSDRNPAPRAATPPKWPRCARRDGNGQAGPLRPSSPLCTEVDRLGGATRRAQPVHFAKPVHFIPHQRPPAADNGEQDPPRPKPLWRQPGTARRATAARRPESARDVDRIGGLAAGVHVRNATTWAAARRMPGHRGLELSSSGGSSDHSAKTPPGWRWSRHAGARRLCRTARGPGAAGGGACGRCRPGSRRTGGPGVRVEAVGRTEREEVAATSRSAGIAGEPAVDRQQPALVPVDHLGAAPRRPAASATRASSSAARAV